MEQARKLPIDIHGISQGKDVSYRAILTKVTPKIARDWLDNHNLSNRNISKAKVDEYSIMMAADLWYQDGNTIVFDSNGRLINGQHRLLALIQADASYAILVVVNADPRGFSTTDTGKNRTAKDILGIIDDNVYKAGDMAALAQSIFAYELGAPGGKHKLKHHDLISIIEKHGEEMYQAVKEANNTRKLRGVGGSVKALAFSFWLISKVDPVAIREFYSFWPRGIGLEADTGPYHLFRQWPFPSKRPTEIKEMSALIIKAYNSWARGATLKLLTFREDELFPTPVRKSTSA